MMAFAFDPSAGTRAHGPSLTAPMRASLLSILRCPYCGGAFDLVGLRPPLPERVDDAVLACACCAYPVIDGVPVMALSDEMSAAIKAVERGDAVEARRLALDLPEERKAAFEDLRADVNATFARSVRTLLPDGEGDYYVLRFGDPTFVVADGVARVLATQVTAGGRLADVCGGCGHLSWTLGELAAGTAPPVLLDRSYWRVWLASRFLCPDADVVACDANLPLPLASGCASLAICNDALHYVWGKRLLCGELQRIAGPSGVVALTHVHSMLADNASAGNTLTPAGYAALFDARDVTLARDEGLLGWAIRGGTVDWHVDPASIGNANALDIVAGPGRSAWPDAPPPASGSERGRWVVNPLLAISADGTRWERSYPSAFYRDEFRDLEKYVPEAVTLAAGDLSDLKGLARRRPDLVANRVLLHVPRGFL
jgi:uncharacterized protein YbaR (Trm112 family)